MLISDKPTIVFSGESIHSQLGLDLNEIDRQ